MNTRPDWQRFGCCGPLGIAVGQEQRPSDVPAWARWWSNRSHIKNYQASNFNFIWRREWNWDSTFSTSGLAAHCGSCAELWLLCAAALL